MAKEFPTLKYSGNGRPIRNRRSTAISGVAPQAVLGSFNNSLHNVLHAILGRVLCAERDGVWVPMKNTLPQPGHTTALSKFFDAIKEMSSETAPIPLRDFPQMFEGRKRKEYEKAVLSLRVRDLDWKDSYIRMFLKFEKDIRSSKPGRIPRVISPPSVRYLVETGRYVKPVEKVIYAVIDQLFGHSTVVKGLNYLQVGGLIAEAWDSFSDPVSFDVDVKKMDRSTGAEILKWVLDVICLFFPGDDKIRDILYWQLSSVVKGRADDGWFSYEVKGTLNSGQTNTALTGVLMVCACVWTYARECGIRVRVVDAGDDFTIIMERKNESRFMAGFAPFFKAQGFDLTISEPNRFIEGIEFCQCHPVQVGGQYRMVRNARDAAIKDTMSVDEITSQRGFIVWTNAVSSSGIATHGGIPVAQEFYAMYGRSSAHSLKTFKPSPRQAKRMRSMMRKAKLEGSMKWWGQGLQLCYQPISWDTRVSYYLAFGITPQEQIALEERYSKYTIEYGPTTPWDYNTFVHIWQ